jgi:hypothetical protein
VLNFILALELSILGNDTNIIKNMFLYCFKIPKIDNKELVFDENVIKTKCR